MGYMGYRDLLFLALWMGRMGSTDRMDRMESGYNNSHSLYCEHYYYMADTRME